MVWRHGLDTTTTLFYTASSLAAIYFEDRRPCVKNASTTVSLRHIYMTCASHAVESVLGHRGYGFRRLDASTYAEYRRRTGRRSSASCLPPAVRDNSLPMNIF